MQILEGFDEGGTALSDQGAAQAVRSPGKIHHHANTNQELHVFRSGNCSSTGSAQPRLAEKAAQDVKCRCIAFDNDIFNEMAG